MSSHDFMRSLRRFTIPLGLAAFLGLVTLLSPHQALAQQKSAVIDMGKAIYETEEGRGVKAKLTKDLERLVELDNKQRALMEERDKLDKEAQAGKTPKETLQRKYETWQRQATELQATMADFQREMQRKEFELTNPIIQKIRGILKRIAAQEGYDMVFDKSVVPYFRSDLDITDRVVQMYNGGQLGEGASISSQQTPKTAKPPSKPPVPQKKK